MYFSRFSVAISPLSSASVAEPGLMSRILSLKYEARRASSGQAVSGSSSRRKKLAGVAGVGKSKCGLYHTSGRGGARENNDGVFELTDPQIHSAAKNVQVNPTGGEFGIGDLGPGGIVAFFKGHRCGVTCRALQLQHMIGTAAQHNEDRQALQNLRKMGKCKTITAGVLSAWFLCSVLWYAMGLQSLSPVHTEL